MTRPGSAPRLASAVLVAILASACARQAAGAGAISHPTGADDLVLRVEYVGGFMAPQALLARVPGFSLYGDGRAITEGPQIDIYPGPALPNLLVQRIDEDGVQAILREARADGLADGNHTYPGCVADVPSIRITVVEDGRTSVTTAGGSVGGGACPGAAADTAPLDVNAFSSKLTNLPRWLPAGSIGGETPYTPSALRVFVERYRRADASLTEPPVAWPGPSLPTFGDPVAAQAGVRCGVVSGSDAEAVLSAAAHANQLTPWTSDGRRYGLVVRPLLPDESTC